MAYVILITYIYLFSANLVWIFVKLIVICTKIGRRLFPLTFILQFIVKRCFGWNFNVGMLHFYMFLQAVIPAICHRTLCARIRFEPCVGHHMLPRRFPSEEEPVTLITLNGKEMRERERVQRLALEVD